MQNYKKLNTYPNEKIIICRLKITTKQNDFNFKHLTKQTYLNFGVGL